MYKQLFKFNKDGAYNGKDGRYDAEHFLASEVDHLVANEGWCESYNLALDKKTKAAKRSKAKANANKKD